MKYKIVFEDFVKKDLEKYMDYIERMTFSKAKAEKFVAEIISSTLVLSIFPYMYQKFYKDYHAINIKNQRVIYYIDEDKKQVVVYRILGQAQDYENIL